MVKTEKQPEKKAESTDNVLAALARLVLVIAKSPNVGPHVKDKQGDAAAIEAWLEKSK